MPTAVAAVVTAAPAGPAVTTAPPRTAVTRTTVMAAAPTGTAVTGMTPARAATREAGVTPTGTTTRIETSALRIKRTGRAVHTPPVFAVGFGCTAGEKGRQHAQESKLLH